MNVSENTLELVVEESTSAKDEIVHIFCDVCYPEGEIAFCGEDLRSHRYVKNFPQDHACVLCVTIESQWEIGPFGYPICPGCGM